MNRNLKSILPHGVAILVFVIFASVYFSPLFTGYNLIQNDINQFKGMSKEIVDQRVMNETDPLWTNSMFGGMPAYQISVLHSNNFINTIDQILKLGLPRPAGILFIAMLGFYILLMCLRINPWLAIAGAVAFGFSTINILYIGAGHMSKVNAIAYMAPALGGMILAFRGKWLLGTAVFALFLSLNLSANHLQMTYYLMFIMVFVAVGEITRIIISKKYKSLLFPLVALFIGVVVAILPSMSNIMTTQEYSQYSTRGTTDLTLEPDGKKMKSSKKSGLDTDYILQYNYGEGELLSTIIPNARGEHGGVFGDDEELMEYVSDRDVANDKQFSNNENFTRGVNRYWGGQASSGGAFYFGVVIFVLFILAMVFLTDSIKWPVILLVILAMSLASNDPSGLNDFFINKFPMYNKFRDSKMILVILQVLIPMLAVLFIDRLFKGNILFRNKQKFFISGGSILLLFAVLYISPGVSGDFMTSEENKQYSKIIDEQPEAKTFINDLKTEVKEARKFLFKKDVGRAFIFSIFILGLIYLIMLKRPSIWIVSGLLLLLISVDNIGVSLRYLSSDEDVEDTRRGEGQRIAALSAQGYLNESEELPVLKDYENSVLTQIPPQLASPLDFRILNLEKSNISDFDNKVVQFKEKMASYYLYEDIKTEKAINMLAEFAVLNLNSNYRVLKIGNPFAETQTSYYHKSIGGYHGAKLKRYQELVDFYIMDEHNNWRPNQNTPILNMLNTKYFIFPIDDKGNKEMILNPNAYGNAWFVENIKTVDNANEEMLALKDIDLRNTAVVHKEFKNVQAPKNIDSMATIRLTKYGLNHLEYSCENDYASPVVFSEIYYPEGWNCYIDGKQVEVFRANYVLRGMMVPAGKHKIEWKFEPKSMETGSLVSGIGSVLLILGCIAVFFIEIKSELWSSDENES